MNADVSINVSVTWKKRFDNEPFRPTRTGTENFHLSTTLDTYTSAVPTFSGLVFAYVGGLRTSGNETSTHIAIRLDNVTHPTPAKGVVPLAKGYIDSALSGGEFIDAQSLTNNIYDGIASLRLNSKY